MADRTSSQFVCFAFKRARRRRIPRDEIAWSCSRTSSDGASKSSKTVHQGEPESLAKLDTGIFVLTNQRVAYLGRTKSTSVALSEVLNVEVYDDGVSIAREGKENPDFFPISYPKHPVFLLNWFLAHNSEVG